jgi:hypothetical protein
MKILSMQQGAAIRRYVASPAPFPPFDRRVKPSEPILTVIVGKRVDYATEA